MSLIPSKLIEVRIIPHKGRGVFSKTFIPNGTEIERVPVIVVGNDLLGSSIDEYLFEWDDETFGIALGFGSIYNHSYEPNARYDDHDSLIKSFTAIRDIHRDEEITVNYNGSPELKDPVGFDVID